MNKISFKKIFNYFLKFIAILILPLLIYLTAVVILGVTPTNLSFHEPADGIEIFIKSNGVHTDIMVPVTNTVKDWSSKIKKEDFKTSDKKFEHISFGWGDKGFYLYTPNWSDLKFSTAFKAMFWLSSSAMHVSYLNYKPIENEHIRKIRIPIEKYKELVGYIDQSFQKNKDGFYIIIPSYHYNGVNDNFYEGEGVYNLFKTCNCWTNSGLKEAGVKTGLWAPFEWAVMYHRE